MSNNLLIKKAKIVAPNSGFNGKKLDILIEKGQITKIKKDISSNAPKFEAKNLHVSPGWFDMRTNFFDPGAEHREDLLSGLRCAAAGGFTGVAIMPNTEPPMDSKPSIDYLINKAKTSAIDAYPIGTVTDKLKGQNISEMYDMHQAGAVAFSDDKQSIKSAELMKNALLYTKSFDGLVINFPNDSSLSEFGNMNEGPTSTKLGLKGIPDLAENMMVSRDISVLSYTQSRLHLSTLSSAKSIDLVKKAKANGENLTCEIAAHQLLLDDTCLESFDSNYKVLPPLRSKKDIKSLIRGIKDGTIDVIVSDHTPQEEETKKTVFDLANYGIIGLETSFAAANTALKDTISIEKLIETITINPRKILKIAIPEIEVGANANLTFFDPDIKWSFETKHIQSKSKNTPFVGYQFTGRPLGIYNKNQLISNL